MERLFDYNRQANKRLIELFLEQNHLNEKLHQLLSHIINAQELWNARIEDRHPQLGVWELIHPSSLGSWNDKVYEQTAELIKTYLFDHRIAYVNSKGDSFTSTLEEILNHLFYHAAYHRGQVAIYMRQIGLEPPNTDFIEFCRAGI